MKMRKIDFDKGRADRRKVGQKFREKPVASPGRSLEEAKPGDPVQKHRAGTPPSGPKR